MARRTRPIRRALHRYPATEAVVRRVVFRVWRLALRRQARAAVVATDPARLIWLHPDEILGAIWKDRNPAFATIRLRDQMGRVIGGDWDLDVIAARDLKVLEAFDQRIHRGTSWPETAYYQDVVRGVREGRHHFGCSTVEAVDERFDRFDALWRAIADGGYKTQTDLGTGRPWDEVMVVIDRDGRPLLIDGRHRWAIAKALDVPNMPAVVVARHKAWHDFVLEVHANAAEKGGRTYQRVLHPDLEEVPSAHGDEGFELIRRNLPISHGRVLDIGANWGYYSHRLEEIGFDCIAVERSEREFYFLDRLRRARDRRFEAIRGSIFDVALPPEFEIVLAINIFHHFLKAQPAFEQLCRFLDRLETRHLFLQTHLASEGQMRGAFRNMEPAEFVDFVSTRARLRSVKDLGTTPDGRSMYLLSR